MIQSFITKNGNRNNNKRFLQLHEQRSSQIWRTTHGIIILTKHSSFFRNMGAVNSFLLFLGKKLQKIRWGWIKLSELSVEENTYISVELPNKAWEIVMLEISRKKIPGKDLRIPYNKAVVTYTPRHYTIRAWVVDKVIGFVEKRWRAYIMKSLHWLRSLRSSDERLIGVRWTASSNRGIHDH